MRHVPLALLLLCAIVANVGAQPAPTSAVVQPTGNYPDATIHMSWPVLDYTYRCFKSNRKQLISRYPGADKLGVFLSQNINDLSYLAINYKSGAEAARFKRTNDFGPSLESVSQWVAADMKPIAAFAEAAILREIQIRDKQFDPSKVIEAWIFTKGVAGDVLVPREEAALVAKRFLTTIQTPDALAGIDQSMKLEIDDFVGKFRNNIDLIIEPKGPFQFNKIDTIRRIANEQKFDVDFRQKMGFPPGV